LFDLQLKLILPDPVFFFQWSINEPGDNVGTDVISPQENASDDKSVEPPVLPSNPPPNGKILMYQKYLE
jgi:hypothetical protein